MEYNPFARETQINPYPVYRWLRDEAPVYQNAEIGFWALSRFDDVLAAHLDPAHVRVRPRRDHRGLDKGRRRASSAATSPATGGTRKLVSRLFTPRAISDLEPKVRGIAAGVLDEARDRGEIDIVAEFSDPPADDGDRRDARAPDGDARGAAPLLRRRSSIAPTPTSRAT